VNQGISASSDTAVKMMKKQIDFNHIYEGVGHSLRGMSRADQNEETGSGGKTRKHRM
jgi:hypothetical protein